MFFLPMILGVIVGIGIGYFFSPILDDLLGGLGVFI